MTTTTPNTIEAIIALMEQKKREASSQLYDLADLIKQLKLKSGILPTMPDGEYKGVRLNELPKEYVIGLFMSGTIDKYPYYNVRDELRELYKEKGSNG